jgi:hypothetical protein
MKPMLSLEHSLAFGYFDLTDSSIKAIYEVELYQLESTAQKPLRMGIEKSTGLFFFENLEPGRYQISRVSGYDRWGSLTSFVAPVEQQNRTMFQISSPGVYFVGVFKLAVTETLYTASFDFNPVSSPDELELLKKLQPYAEGTRWVERIEDRLKMLQENEFPQSSMAEPE